MTTKLQRTMMSRLEAWRDASPKMPLLLRGARQTGKTWIVNEFGDLFYDHVLRIDFMRDESAKAFFDGSLEPNAILDDLSAYTGVPVIAGKTLIFFDEIQECPRALTSLKYFCEEAAEHHIIAAGSYMGASRHEAHPSP